MGSSWGGMYGFLYMLSHPGKINSYACIDGKINSIYQTHSLIDYEINLATKLITNNISKSRAEELKLIISELERIKNSGFKQFHVDVNWMKHQVPPKLGFNAYFADTSKIISFNDVLQDSALMGLMKYSSEEYLEVGEKAEIVNRAFRNNANYNNINIEKELASIKTPTLIIQGDQDYVVGLGHAKLIYNALTALPASDKELHLIPNTGHCPAIEEPELLSGIMIAFFEKYNKQYN
jgi:pimeloyl-ACP methyl ester carboxylesterase